MCDECKRLIENLMNGELDRVHLHEFKGIRIGIVACQEHANAVINKLAKKPEVVAGEKK